jgi:integration host factor subunit alpha
MVKLSSVSAERQAVRRLGKGESMRKADIANEIYKQVGISKNEAADIVELVLNMLKAVLQKGDSVKIAGFGNFVVRSKGARKGRNPRTGEEIGITPRRVVTFRPSQVFKKYVNS